MEYAAYSCSEGGFESPKPCTASLAAILESDCRVPYDFSDICSGLCLLCQSALFKYIKNRRERLKTYALESVPRAESAREGLLQPGVLDSRANLAVETLEKRGFNIPSALRLDGHGSKYHSYVPTSMFHWCGSMFSVRLHSRTRSDFDTLVELGFRDFQPLDCSEFSPLLSWCEWLVNPDAATYEARIWFIEHGANLWDPIPNRNFATQARYLYGSIQLAPKVHVNVELERINFTIQFLTRILSARDVRDGCRCRCSSEGCSPFTWFLRWNITLELHNDRNPDNFQRFMDSLPEFFTDCHPNITMEQLRSAIRYKTFHALGIRHTCSHDGRGQVDELTEDEVDELLSEDALLLRILGESVEEFQSELESLLPEDPCGLFFWEHYWPERMTKVT